MVYANYKDSVNKTLEVDTIECPLMWTALSHKEKPIRNKYSFLQYTEHFQNKNKIEA